MWREHQGEENLINWIGVIIRNTGDRTNDSVIFLTSETIFLLSHKSTRILHNVMDI